MIRGRDFAFVNALRGALGLEPLYKVGRVGESSDHGYARPERWARRAQRDCSTCGGSGQVLGSMHGDHRACACTGAARSSVVRNPYGRRGKPKADGDRA